MNDPEISHLIGGWSYPVSMVEQKEWFHRSIPDKTTQRWIVERDDGAVIGLPGLWQIDLHNRHALTGLKLGHQALRGRVPARRGDQSGGSCRSGLGIRPELDLRTALKRAFDVAIAVGMAPLAVPLVLAIGALARFETPGPVIFRQTRVGRRGAAFTIYKLRRMVDNAANIGAGPYSPANDPRYTRVGIFTRRWSLDELPQLYNVFVGDMSVVGPRPVLKSTVDEYQNEYDTILQVRPGLTGLSQVNGRNLLSRRDRLKLDMHYAREWSFAMDLRILCRSIVVVLTGDGQTNSQSRADVEGEQRGS